MSGGFTGRKNDRNDGEWGDKKAGFKWGRFRWKFFSEL
jgi:hypothetical protein